MRRYASLLLLLPLVAAPSPESVRRVAALETSITPVLAEVIVKPRSVLTVEPVYCNVPPPENTKFDVALVACPIPLAAPPFANVPTLSTPPPIVVTPV